MNNELRWKQRFQNFNKAFQVFQRRIDEHEKYPDNEAYQMALVKSFEIIQELSWKTLKDYLENEGVDVKDSPKDVFRHAFQNELILKIEPWMESVIKRNETNHTYDENILQETVRYITNDFYPIVRDLYFRLQKEL